jgi:hypothetical protein
LNPTYSQYARVVQGIERFATDEEVGGSNPSASTLCLPLSYIGEYNGLRNHRGGFDSCEGRLGAVEKNYGLVNCTL